VVDLFNPVDCNQTNQQLPWQKTTMTYDKENRTKTFAEDTVVQTYTYDGDGQKRTENKNGTVTTIVWDGTDYLGEI
jgi:YD repeat-containing protein